MYFSGQVGSTRSKYDVRPCHVLGLTRFLQKASVVRFPLNEKKANGRDQVSYSSSRLTARTHSPLPFAAKAPRFEQGFRRRRYQIFPSPDHMSSIIFFERVGYMSVLGPKLERRHTGLGKIVGPRLRELAPSRQRKPGGGIHATLGPLFSPSL